MSATLANEGNWAVTQSSSSESGWQTPSSVSSHDLRGQQKYIERGSRSAEKVLDKSRRSRVVARGVCTEYDANSYKGCSGAVVIIMDPDHDDYRKAVAVHTGYKDELDSNIGFQLAGALNYA